MDAFWNISDRHSTGGEHDFYHLHLSFNHSVGTLGVCNIATTRGGPVSGINFCLFGDRRCVENVGKLMPGSGC